MTDIRLNDSSIFNNKYTLIACFAVASAKYLDLGLTTGQLACLNTECLNYYWTQVIINSIYGKNNDIVLYSKKLLGIAQETGHKQAEICAYINLGNAYFSLKKYNDAIFYSKKWLVTAQGLTGVEDTEMKAYMNIGNAYFMLNKYHDAILYSVKLLGIAQDTGYKVAEMAAYINLGNAYLSLEKYDDAIRCSKEYLAIPQETGVNKITVMMAYKILGKAYLSLENDDDAIFYSEKCLAIAQETDHKIVEMNAYDLLGDAYLSLERYDDAVLYSKKCLGIAQETREKVPEMKAYQTIGNAYLRLKKYDDAILYSEELLGIAQDTGYKVAEIAAYLNLGNAYLSLKKYDDAKHYSEKGLNIAQETGEKVGEMNACKILGNVYLSLKKYNDAVCYSKKCLDIAQETTTQGNEIFNSEIRVDTILKSIDKARRDNEMSVYIVLVKSCHSLEQYNDVVLYSKKCIEIKNKINDKSVKMDAVLLLCKMYNLMEQYEDAIHYGKECAELARETGNKVYEMNSHTMLGDVFYNLKQHEECLYHCRKCVEIAKEIRDEVVEAYEYFSCSKSLCSVNQYDNAIVDVKKCIGIAIKIGRNDIVMNAYFLLADLHFNLVQYNDAIRYCKKCNKIAKAINNSSMKMKALLLSGVASTSLNQYNDAYSYLTEGLEIANSLKDNDDKIREFKSSLFTLDESVGMTKEYANNKDENDFSHFLETEDTDVNNQEEQNIRKMDTYQFRYLYHKSRDEHDQAISCLKDATVAAKSISNRQPVFSLHILVYKKAISEMCVQLGQYDKGMQYYKEGLTLALQLSNKHYEALCHCGLGTIYYKLEQPDKAEVSLKQSIQCFEFMFDHLGEHDRFKISMVDKYSKAYKMLLKVLIKTNKKEVALLLSDSFRARALKDLLVSNFGIKKEEMTKESLQYSDIQALVSRNNYSILFYSMCVEELYTFLVEPGNELQLSVQSYKICDSCLDDVIEKAFNEMKVRQVANCEDRSLDAIFNCKVHLNLNSDQKFELTQLQKISSEPSRCTCDSRGEPSENSDESSSMTGAPVPFAAPRDPDTDCDKEMNWVEKGEDQHVCKKPKRNVYEEPWRKENDSSLRNTLRELHQKLLTKVMAFNNKDEIVIITDGPLSKVPFAALLDPKKGRYLSETKRIRFAPSITTLKFLQECPTDSYCKTGALIIGDPLVGRVMLNDMEQFIGPLKNARKEAEELAKVLGVKPLVGEGATKPVVMKRLKLGASIVHIAAHGILSQSAIVLAPSPETRATKILPDEEDYMLTMADVQKAKVRAQLVVLSCCHSGRGKIRAEGVVGMCRAFLASGARAVVASLWAIEDSATRKFMKKFYKHLKKGNSASTSLHLTMNDMRKIPRFSEPKYWAPFFLMGDDVTIQFKQ